MVDRHLRVGIIGTGVGIRTHLPGFRATGRARVVAISGSDLERSREVARANDIPTGYANYQELCDDPSIDLICVASPNEYHLDHYRAAVASGKHVLLEKPAATSRVELGGFLQEPTNDCQIVLINHQLRFNPYVIAIRDSIKRGELGRPYYIRIHQQSTGFFPPESPYNWSFDAARGGGVRLAMGSHLVDLVNFLLDDTTTEAVFGTQDVVNPTRRDTSGQTRRVTASAAFACILRRATTTVVLSASAHAASENLFNIDVLGTDGEAHFSLADKLAIATRTESRRLDELDGCINDELTQNTSIFRSSFIYLANALVSAILDGRLDALAAGCQLADQGPTLQILDAIRDSAMTATAVTLSSESPSNADG